MKDEYKAWIDKYVRSHNGFVRGLCRDATVSMRIDFPELRIAKGFATAPWGEDEHHWCVAPDSTIVDPTAWQYGPAGPAGYDELNLNDPKDVARIPIGKCMNCGDRTFMSSLSSMCCSEACEAALRAEYG